MIKTLKYQEKSETNNMREHVHSFAKHMTDGPRQKVQTLRCIPFLLFQSPHTFLQFQSLFIHLIPKTSKVFFFFGSKKILRRRRLLMSHCFNCSSTVTCKLQPHTFIHHPRPCAQRKGGARVAIFFFLVFSIHHFQQKRYRFKKLIGVAL